MSVIPIFIDVSRVCLDGNIINIYFEQVDGNTMLVMDSFALPVEGTETRVNAQAQAYEYMTAYIEAAKLVRLIV